MIAQTGAPVSVTNVSRQAGSKWRSYQVTYSSTMAPVAGWVVTSATNPSFITQTRRPSRRDVR